MEPMETTNLTLKEAPAVIWQRFADPDLLARSLAWAGLTVTPLAAGRYLAAADDVRAIVSVALEQPAVGQEGRLELRWQDEADEAGQPEAAATLTLRCVDAAEAQWQLRKETVSGVPATVAQGHAGWIERVLTALTEQLTVAPAPGPGTGRSWVIWLAAFVVLLLALGLAQ